MGGHIQSQFDALYGDRRRNEKGTLSPSLFSTAGLKSFSVMRHNHGRLHLALQRLHTKSAGIRRILVSDDDFCRFDQKERIANLKTACDENMLKTIPMKEKQNQLGKSFTLYCVQDAAHV